MASPPTTPAVIVARASSVSVAQQWTHVFGNRLQEARVNGDHRLLAAGPRVMKHPDRPVRPRLRTR
jgi:hypothetical protein